MSYRKLEFSYSKIGSNEQKVLSTIFNEKEVPIWDIEETKKFFQELVRQTIIDLDKTVKLWDTLKFDVISQNEKVTIH